MFAADGRRFVVVDAQVHAWDGSPRNQASPDGEQHVRDLHLRHSQLAGDGAVTPLEDFERVTEAALYQEVFGEGHVDVAVLQPLVLSELFVLGFSPVDWHAELAGLLPGRLVVTGALDPAAGSADARRQLSRSRRGDLHGVHLSGAARPGGEVALSADWLRRTLVRWKQAGIGTVHVDLCPVPRAGTRHGFAASELHDLARALPGIQFVVGAHSMPMAHLCRLGRALPNVHVALADLLPAIRIWPDEFAQSLSALIRAFGSGRLLFGSGYPLVRPGWLVEQLVAYRFPPEISAVCGELSVRDKRRILGLNAARLYGVDVPTEVPDVPPTIFGPVPDVVPVAAAPVGAAAS